MMVGKQQGGFVRGAIADLNCLMPCVLATGAEAHIGR